MNVSGLSIEDILSMDAREVSRLSRSDLSKVTSRLASAANKRIKRAETAQGGTFAQTVLDRAGGRKFSVKGKSQGQLQGEFARLRQFFSAKTSSVKGAKPVFQNTMERIGAKDAAQASNLWKIYERIKRTYPDLVTSGRGSERIQEMIRQMEYKDDPDAMYTDMLARIQSEYEELTDEYEDAEEEAYNGFTDASDLFDIGENPFL